MTYDAANQMTRVVNYTSANAVLTDFDYARDAVGNPTRTVEANGDRVTYTYDAAYQLTRVRRSGTNAYDTTYLYDAGGNRRAKIDSAARTTSVYDAANQLRYSLDATGRTTYTFDATGNQLVTLTPAGARTTNTWDFENRLTRVKLPTGVVNTMTYNGDNLRVQKVDSAGTSKFIWDGQNVLMETDAANASNAVYTARPAGYGSMLSQRRKSGAVWTPSYYHFDQLGTVAALTSSAQAVTDTYKYQAFGEALATTGTTKNAFRYVGALQYYFDSDLAQYYVRRRVYLPSIARWLSVIRTVAGQLLRYDKDNEDFIGDKSEFYYVLFGDLNTKDTSGNECPCGGFSGSPRFYVAAGTGWIIQRISMSSKTAGCNGEPVSKFSFAFYEAFQVVKGRVYPGRAADNADRKLKWAQDTKSVSSNSIFHPARRRDISAIMLMWIIVSLVAGFRS